MSVSISDSRVCFLECDNKMAAVLMQRQILKATEENAALSLSLSYSLIVFVMHALLKYQIWIAVHFK